MDRVVSQTAAIARTTATAWRRSVYRPDFPARRGILEDPANACNDVLDVCALGFHSGTGSRRTSSRIKWLRERRITTWTRLPSSCSRSAAKLPGNHGVVSPVTSIRKSTSLSGVSSPRATEPKIRTFPAPWRVASRRISSRCSLIWRPAFTTPFYRSAVCAPVSVRITAGRMDLGMKPRGLLIVERWLPRASTSCDRS
jgi:hypothetical protein